MYNWIMLAAGAAVGAVMLLRFKGLDGNASSPRSISVVIPARNEAHNIGGIVGDLKQQSLEPLEIICVDDDSSDSTADIARAGGVKVIEEKDRPSGWIGKTWASQKGAQAAEGDMLLFLDADVRLSRDALCALSAQYEQKGGVVSVQPYHTVKKPYEHLSMFFNIISVAATGAGMPFFKRAAGMFGPVLLVGRNTYLEQGGHGAVKSKILEDFFLGKHYSEKNIPVTLKAGKPGITYRMYPGGIKDLWQGWTKNFFSGAVSVSPIMLVLMVVWITALTSISISLVRSLISIGPETLIYAGVYALLSAEVLYASKKVGSFSWLAGVFFPVFLLGFHVIFFSSVVKRLVFRRVTWKGRNIDFKGE